MINVKNETERLTRQFISQLEAIGAQMTAETKAVSWAMAAEAIAAGLQAIAVGCLTWEGESSVRRAKLAVSVVPKPAKAPQPRVYGPKVRIEGPSPKARADHYTGLLAKRSGAWSRRDGKVRYTVCDTRVTHSVNKAFYKMRRIDNGVEKWIKFTSICSDWKYIPYP